MISHLYSALQLPVLQNTEISLNSKAFQRFCKRTQNYYKKVAYKLWISRLCTSPTTIDDTETNCFGNFLLLLTYQYFRIYFTYQYFCIYFTYVNTYYIFYIIIFDMKSSSSHNSSEF